MNENNSETKTNNEQTACFSARLERLGCLWDMKLEKSIISVEKTPPNKTKHHPHSKNKKNPKLTKNTQN